jgi:hypothetical protein
MESTDRPAGPLVSGAILRIGILAVTFERGTDIGCQFITRIPTAGSGMHQIFDTQSPHPDELAGISHSCESLGQFRIGERDTGGGQPLEQLSHHVAARDYRPVRPPHRTS